MTRKTRNNFAGSMREVIPTYDICTIKQDTFASDDLLVSGFASYLKTRPLLVKPHKHKFYHLVYFTKGSGTHTVDFVNFAVKPGEIYFMAPGQVHSWNFAGETDGYIVNFSETFFRSFLLDHRYLERFPFFSGVAERGVIFLNAAQQKQARDIFSGMLQALSLKDDFTDVSVKLLLLQLFILVERVEAQLGHGAPKHASNIVVRSFQSMVEEKYLQLRMPKNYAGQLFISPKYLNDLCVKALGIPAGEVIRNRVMLEAKRLLVNGDTTISQISHQLNFTDHSHFSKFFKKSAGVSPEDFRKKYSGTT